MSAAIHNIPENDLKEAISRLAYFSPSTTDNYGNQLLDYLILDCAIDFGTTTVSANDIRTAIKENLLVDFAEDEIVSSARRLASKDFIKILEPLKRFDKPKIQILEKIESQFSSNRDSLFKLEEEVFEDWKNEILSKYEGDNSVAKNVHKLTSIVQNFTSKMFVKHGIETVSLLYPGENKVKLWLKEGANEMLEKLIPVVDDFFTNLVKIEIPKFFQSDNSIRNQYISNLFNSSFFWHLIQVDEKCSKLLRSVTKDQKLFLDNNILYSLVGLHGKDALESSSAMLKFADELGYNLNVTTKTLDEFQNTLKWHLNETRDSLPLSSSLAKIALKELGPSSFLTVFWEKMVKQGVSIEEFVANISYIEDVLVGLNIGTFVKFRNDIESSEELTNEMSLLRKACGDHINIHIVEHDAFHRVLITKLRKGLKYNFNDAKAWFLTHDHKLPQYSKYARKGKAHIPFCITTNEWIQINRPLLVRTKSQEEYEKSFHVLVTQSYVRSMLPTLPLEKAYNKILGKLERYQGMTPEIAARVASDTHFMISLLDIDNERDIEKKIENRLIDLNKELRQQNEQLILKNKSEASKVQKLEDQVEYIISELQTTKDTHQSVLTQQEEKETKYKTTIEKLKSELNKEKQSTSTLSSKLSRLEINNAIKNWKAPAYFAIVAMVLLLIQLILVFAYQSKNWNYITTFFNWAESQSEMRKEILKWVIILILSIGELLLGKLIWNRLISKSELESFKDRLT